MKITPANLGTVNQEMQSIREQISNQTYIPDSLPNYSQDFLLNGFARHHWQKVGMYAFVSWKWVIPFVEWIGERKVLEVMSGAGWLAKALREKNVDVIATDSRKWEMWAKKQHPWPVLTPIEKISANKAIVKYGKQVDILLMSWPYQDPAAYHALKLLHKINPDALVVYIGSWGKYCAEEKFFEHFFPINDTHFIHQVANKYESWQGYEDNMFVGKFNPKPFYYSLK